MEPDCKGLRGKVVLITGASSGIGRACVLSFAEEGSFLAITGRNKDALLKVKETCLSLGLKDDQVLIVIAELDKEGEPEKVVKETVDHFKRIDVLVNNAGAIAFETLETNKIEDFDHIMNINVRVPFLLSKLCLPYLLESKGNIVNMSSLYALRAEMTTISYSISKGAIEQLTRCLAQEVAGRGVRVNSVNPGIIKTDLFVRAGMRVEDEEKFYENWNKVYPMGRVGEVEEVGKVVVFVASSQASFITGASFPIDGGKSLTCPR